MAMVLVASALVAGCSSTTGGDAKSAFSPTTPPTTRATSTYPSTSASRPPIPPRPSAIDSAPTAGADIGDVISWIEGGVPVDAAAYHSATRDATTTPLGAQVAFTTAGAETSCMTNGYVDGALACLVELADPPRRPPDFPTAWKNNWVDFAGTTVDVGSPHGDPGPFVAGTGTELPAGHTLAFGEYGCRADEVGLFCVDYAHRTAIRMAAAGVEGFGCLQEVTPPPEIGRRLSC